MIDKGYTDCVYVECALPGCNRVHLVILDEKNAMNSLMLIHCMGCLSVMETKVEGENEKTGQVEGMSRVVHTRNQLRATIESEMNKGCQN